MKKLYIQSIVACLLYSGSITPADRSITCNELWQALHGDSSFQEESESFALMAQQISEKKHVAAINMLSALQKYKKATTFCESIAWKTIASIRRRASYDSLVELLNDPSLAEFKSIQKLLRIIIEIPEVAFTMQKKAAARKAAHEGRSASPKPDDHSTVTFCSSSEEGDAACFPGSESDNSNPEFTETAILRDSTP